MCLCVCVCERERARDVSEFHQQSMSEMRADRLGVVLVIGDSQLTQCDIWK